MSRLIPRVSIIIPTFARPEAIEGCLESLCALTYPRESFEVIVVDDGSDRPPVEAVARAAREIDVTLLARPHAGPAIARNAAAAVARGEILAFTDDDCRPDPGWLEALTEAVREDPARAAGGPTVNALEGNFFSSGSQLLVDYLYHYYNHDGRQVRFLASCNLAMPRAAFQSIGGFDEKFPRAAAEDRDLCASWLSSGHEMVYVPDAVVRHHHRLGPTSVLRQHFTYGRGAYNHRVRLEQRGSERSSREPLSFYLELMRYPFGRMSFLRACAYSFLLGVTQVANVIGYFYERRHPHPAGAIERTGGRS